MNETANVSSASEVVNQVTGLVRNLARSLVDQPHQVVVECVPQGEGTHLRLHVAPEDIGQVIGKQGRTARSLRTLVSAAGMKMRHQFTLEIVDTSRLPQEMASSNDT